MGRKAARCQSGSEISVRVRRLAACEQKKPKSAGPISQFDAPGAPRIVTLLSSSFSRLSRRNLMRVAGAAVRVCWLSAQPGRKRRPSPIRPSKWPRRLEPGPLPELSIGDAAGMPVIEYGSATCPHCAHFAKDIWPEFKKAYVDTGKVRFIFREYSRNNLDVGRLHAGALRRRRQGLSDDRASVRLAGLPGPSATIRWRA